MSYKDRAEVCSVYLVFDSSSDLFEVTTDPTFAARLAKKLSGSVQYVSGNAMLTQLDRYPYDHGRVTHERRATKVSDS